MQSVHMNYFVSLQLLPSSWVLSWCVFLFTSMDYLDKTPQRYSHQRLRVQKRDLLLCDIVQKNGQTREKKRTFRKPEFFKISLKLAMEQFKWDRLQAEVSSVLHVKFPVADAKATLPPRSWMSLLSKVFFVHVGQ